MMDETPTWHQESLPKNRNFFKIQKERVIFKLSEKGTEEEASEVILSGTSWIGSHIYKSNWVVANNMHDVQLEMPWHVAHNPNVNYVQQIVQIGS